MFFIFLFIINKFIVKKLTKAFNSIFILKLFIVIYTQKSFIYHDDAKTTFLTKKFETSSFQVCNKILLRFTLFW